jgi:hAT family C-terminal dimerisation region
MFKKSNFFSTYCSGLEKPPSGWDNIKREIPEPAMTVWVIHDEKNKDGSSKNYLQLMKKDLTGVIVKDDSSLWLTPSRIILSLLRDKFWKANAFNYPILSAMAKDYLTVQASSVPSERAFSSGVDLVTAERCT